MTKNRSRGLIVASSIVAILFFAGLVSAQGIDVPLTDNQQQTVDRVDTSGSIDDVTVDDIVQETAEIIKEQGILKTLSQGFRISIRAFLKSLGF